MPTLQTAEELTALAQDRPLATSELHQSSDYYGHAALIKHYCGLPQEYPLKAAIEHGVQLNGVVEYIWEVDRDTVLPVFLCANPDHAAHYAQATGKTAVAIGPMVLYALGGVPADPIAAPDAQGRLLVIPTHSTHHIESRYDIDAFLAHIRPYLKQFNDVSVLLYWKDVLSGQAELYGRYGFNVVTAGHMFDPGFLLRWAQIVAEHQAVVSNCVGTHTLFTALMHKPTWVVPQQLEYFGTYDVTKARRSYSLLPTPEERTLYDLFAEPQDTLTEEQHEYVTTLTGAACFKDRSALRDILLFAEKRFAPYYKDQRHHLAAMRTLASAGG